MQTVLVKCKGILSKDDKEHIEHQVNMALNKGIFVYDDYIDVTIADVSDLNVLHPCCASKEAIKLE